ncbi:hypothetical protein Fmac_008544 [Flemingia macrophylla]|uniref:Uncharacterized protein n=1 Tax=Flemingia macrophylla TaxID=520843 RepID=A0ABD1MXS7_9FABA
MKIALNVSFSLSCGAKLSACFLFVDEKVSLECRSPIARQHSAHYRMALFLDPFLLMSSE